MSFHSNVLNPQYRDLWSRYCTALSHQEGIQVARFDDETLISQDFGGASLPDTESFLRLLMTVMQSVKSAIDHKEKRATIDSFASNSASIAAVGGLTEMFLSFGVLLTRGENREIKLRWREEGYAALYQEIHNCPTPKIPGRITPLPRSMQRLYDTRVRTDMLVGKEPVHSSIVMARSSMIETMITSEMMEGVAEHPAIMQAYGDEEIKILVHYLYFGDLGSLPDEPLQLLVNLLDIAEMYDIKNLKETLDAELTEKSDSLNFRSLEEVAEKFQLEGLLRQCKYLANTYPSLDFDSSQGTQEQDA